MDAAAVSLSLGRDRGRIQVELAGSGRWFRPGVQGAREGSGVREQGPGAGSRRSRSLGSGSGCGFCSAPFAPAPEVQRQLRDSPPCPPARGCPASRPYRRAGRGRVQKPRGRDVGSGLRGQAAAAPEERQSGLTPVRRAPASPPRRARSAPRCGPTASRHDPAPSCRPPVAEPRGGAGPDTAFPPAPCLPRRRQRRREPAVPAERAASAGAALPSAGALVPKGGTGRRGLSSFWIQGPQQGLYVAGGLTSS